MEAFSRNFHLATAFPFLHLANKLGHVEARMASRPNPEAYLISSSRGCTDGPSRVIYHLIIRLANFSRFAHTLNVIRSGNCLAHRWLLFVLRRRRSTMFELDSRDSGTTDNGRAKPWPLFATVLEEERSSKIDDHEPQGPGRIRWRMVFDPTHVTTWWII